MRARRFNPDTDTAEWVRMRLLLWPEGTAVAYEAELSDMLADEQCVIFVYPRPNSGLCGFLEMSIRHDYVEGCDTSPVGYMEGWFVDEAYRQQGVGRQLFTAGETWARERGLTEIGSDTELENLTSITAHEALGYREMGRNVHFRKKLT